VTLLDIYKEKQPLMGMTNYAKVGSESNVDWPTPDRKHQ
jgi:hypothetical protein